MIKHELIHDGQKQEVRILLRIPYQMLDVRVAVPATTPGVLRWIADLYEKEAA